LLSVTIQQRRPLVRRQRLADEHGRPHFAHMARSRRPRLVSGAYGKRPIEHLAALGVLAQCCLTHVVHWRGRGRLAGPTGTNVTFCPGAAMKGGFRRVRQGASPRWPQAGVTVMLGPTGADHAD